MHEKPVKALREPRQEETVQTFQVTSTFCGRLVRHPGVLFNMAVAGWGSWECRSVDMLSRAVAFGVS